ncbi:sigma-70 family RNA polymerase sigma factor [Polyangium fumosum]|uniref:Sigma-70 family RNA polymerase sigma factor n=1 Tax=Polyangium fumosum TaxID=889272 RepID=A0A4U1JA61_9BACT|nr:sigma-70 family RNA polymerase sigma factor [Polyangium fumosum]TKD05303.1 sigma-70 family RNA polymerase sigma factor [Polyangium fumosum]
MPPVDVAPSGVPWKDHNRRIMGPKALSSMSVEELLRHAREGDEAALEALIHRSGPMLAKRASRHRSRVEPGGARPSDIAQETALRAWSRFASFTGTTEAEWFVWLERILHSRAEQSARHARRKKRDAGGARPLDSSVATTAPTPDQSPSQAAAEKENWKRLLGRVYDLPEDQRDAIWFRLMEALPVAEVARRMGKTETSVAGLLQRACKTLRSNMAEGSSEDAGERTGRASTSSEAASALLVYLRRRDAGEQVENAAFVAAHPDCADELQEILHWIERIQSLRPAAAPGA